MKKVEFVVTANNTKLNEMIKADSLVTYYGVVGGFHKVVETPDGFLRKPKRWFFAVGTLRPHEPKMETVMLQSIERRTHRRWNA